MNTHMNAHLNNFSAHYEVICITNGQMKTRTFPTLSKANTCVKQYAEENGLTLLEDADGWLSCADNKETPQQEAYLMHIKGPRYEEYLDCCANYGEHVVSEAVTLVSVTGEPDGAWSLFSDMNMPAHQEVIEILFFSL